MHISYKPLWHTLVERNMRKEDLRIAAGLTTNMIANMGKGKNISMETLGIRHQHNHFRAASMEALPCLCVMRKEYNTPV